MINNIEVVNNTNNISVESDPSTINVDSTTNEVIVDSEVMNVTVESNDNNVSVDSENINITVESDSTVIEVRDSGPQGPVGNASWGMITGTLSDQTDLQDALDDKADKDNLYVINLANKGGKDISGLPTLITYNDYEGVTSNTKTFTYSGDFLSQSVQQFTYNSRLWTVTINYSNDGSSLTEISDPIITKV